MSIIKHRKMSLVLLLSLLLASFNMAFAGVSNDIIDLNASYDSRNDIVTINGEFENEGIDAAAFQIIKPDGDILFFGSTRVEDKMFTEALNVGNLAYGTYTVKAADYKGGDYFTTTFSYTRVYSPTKDPADRDENDELSDAVQDNAWKEPSDSPDEYYIDIPTNYSWSVKAINFLTERGIVNGIGDGKFGPALNVKRGDVILMIVNAFKLEGQLGVPFNDVEASKYYTNAIGIARALGIATGDGISFRPEESITREDAIVLLFRILKMRGIMLPTIEIGKDINSFNDGENVSEYAKEALNEFIKAGIVRGDGHNLNAKSNITRAEMATILYRIFEIIEK